MKKGQLTNPPNFWLPIQFAAEGVCLTVILTLLIRLLYPRSVTHQAASVIFVYKTCNYRETLIPPFWGLLPRRRRLRVDRLLSPNYLQLINHVSTTYPNTPVVTNHNYAL